MFLYLDLVCEQAKGEHLWLSKGCLYEAIVEGAAKRLRPKFMSFAAMTIGLVRILGSAGIRSEIMKRIAAPMVCGIGTSFTLELLVYPAIYAVWRERHLNQEVEHHSLEASGFVGADTPGRAFDPSDTLESSGFACF